MEYAGSNLSSSPSSATMGVGRCSAGALQDCRWIWPFRHQLWCTGWALEGEQGNSCGEGRVYGQRFQLIHLQGLDLGAGGRAQEAVRLA